MNSKNIRFSSKGRRDCYFINQAPGEAAGLQLRGMLFQNTRLKLNLPHKTEAKGPIYSMFPSHINSGAFITEYMAVNHCSGQTQNSFN